MAIDVVFETHALSEDNERGIATGWWSHTAAITRVTRLFAELPTRWAGRRIMLIGHLATYRALELVTTGRSVRELVADDFTWQAHGWEYRLG